MIEPVESNDMTYNLYKPNHTDIVFDYIIDHQLVKGFHIQSDLDLYIHQSLTRPK